MSNSISTSITGAISGFLAAFIIDLHAFNKAIRESGAVNVKFDWKLAITRWLIGAVSGFIAAGAHVDPQLLTGSAGFIL